MSIQTSGCLAASLIDVLLPLASRSVRGGEGSSIHVWVMSLFMALMGGLMGTFPCLMYVCD